jgi:hypothetical protein
LSALSAVGRPFANRDRSGNSLPAFAQFLGKSKDMHPSQGIAQLRNIRLAGCQGQSLADRKDRWASEHNPRYNDAGLHGDASVVVPSGRGGDFAHIADLALAGSESQDPSNAIKDALPGGAG